MEKSTKLHSKFKYSNNLFKPEAPEQPALVKSLFVGRAKELRRGVEILRQCQDVNGKQSKSQDKRPWVIHGESRSGKSHLARRILLDLPHGPKRIQMIVSAREQLEAIRVMRQLFETLRDHYQVCTRDQRLSRDVLSIPWVRVTDELIDRVASLVGQSGVESMTLKWSKETKTSLETGIQLPFVPKVLEFVFKMQGGATTTDGQEIKLRPPTPADMAEFSAIIVDTLLRLKLLQHVLILVDDVDLLEGYTSAIRNGRIERSILAQALADLNGTAGIDVMLTARSWYAQSKRDFNELVDLATAPEMTTEELVSLHDRRFLVYGNKDLPRRFLDSASLTQAASDVNGMPGVFLQHLDTAFRAFQDEDSWDERSYEWYVGVFRRKWNTYRDKSPQAAQALEGAVANGRRTIDCGDKNLFYGTVFDNEFVYQSYYQETNYYMDALAHRVISGERSEPVD